MEKSSSEESAIHRSPSVDSCDSEFARASSSGRPFGGRGFTAGAFYGSTGRKQSGTDNKESNKPITSKSSKYVVFYLDLSFVFLLEFKKCNMASGFLCCLKYTMFFFNLIFWVSDLSLYVFFFLTSIIHLCLLLLLGAACVSVCLFARMIYISQLFDSSIT